MIHLIIQLFEEMCAVIFLSNQTCNFPLADEKEDKNAIDLHRRNVSPILVQECH